MVETRVAGAWASAARLGLAALVWDGGGVGAVVG